MSRSSDRLKGKKTLKVGGILDELEKDGIREEVDIVQLFSSFGVKLREKGTSFMGLCPFHDDHEPSLSVDRGKGLFHCFGCGAGGDVFDAVQRFQGVGFKEALAFLKKWVPSKGSAGTAAPKPAPNKERSISTRTPEPQQSLPPSLPRLHGRAGSEASDQPTATIGLKEIAGYYHDHLSKHRTAMDYLRNRGLRDTRIWKRYGLGFADGSLLSKLSAKQKEGLKEIGVISTIGKEHFSGCITVPLLDEAEQIVGMYGRRIDGGSPAHLYLPGGHKGLFNRGAAKVYRDGIILTESIIDGLSLLHLGMENVLPCYGVNGFTDAHLQLLKDERVELLIIAFDGDAAGRAGAEKLGPGLVDEGFKVKVLGASPGTPATSDRSVVKDWNDALLAGVTREAVKQRIDETPVEEKEQEEVPFHVEKDGPKYVFSFTDLNYRILGAREIFVSSLRVNVRVERNEDNKKYLDNVDLYSARSRSSFALQASMQFGLEASRVERDLLLMVDHLEGERDRALSIEAEEEYVLSPEEERLGMELLQDAALMDRIVEDTEVLGYVGESTNKLLLYIAASTRKLADPLSVLVISESAAGKSYLIDTVKKLMPPEEVVSMTSLSDQALNYLPENGLLHKFLIMGEAVHGEVVEHQVREMLSAHELSRLVTMKDPKTGELSSRTVRKEVIVSVAMSSTDYEVNPENASRCFVINTDESEAQTRAIHGMQRRKYSFGRYEEREEAIPRIIKQHRSAQRLLKSRMIINPLSEKIRFPSTLMRSRRDHERFLDLIAGVCFLRQYQKDVKSRGRFEYIECDEKDFEIASGLMKEILASTLMSFPKSAQLLYEKIREEIGKKARSEKLGPTEVSVTQREIREATGLHLSFVRRNIRILVDYEYLKVMGAGTRGSRRSYRLYADEGIAFLDLELLEGISE